MSDEQSATGSAAEPGSEQGERAKRAPAKRRKSEGAPARKMGRPSKLTSELEAKILKLIEDGAFLKDACLEAGISVQTFENWLNAGRMGRQPYADFLDATERARSKCTNRLVIKKVLKGDRAGVSFGPAKASLEFLARTQPKRFGTRINLRVEEELGAFLDRLERELDRATYLKVLAIAESMATDESEPEADQSLQPESTEH